MPTKRKEPSLHCYWFLLDDSGNRKGYSLKNTVRKQYPRMVFDLSLPIPTAVSANQTWYLYLHNKSVKVFPLLPIYKFYTECTSDKADERNGSHALQTIKRMQMWLIVRSIRGMIRSYFTITEKDPNFVKILPVFLDLVKHYLIDFLSLWLFDSAILFPVFYKMN